MSEDISRIEQLKNLLLSYAENNSAGIKAVEEMYKDMVVDDLNDTMIEWNFAEAIATGLRHGNWPWTFLS